jgi:hypothetical protein
VYKQLFQSQHVLFLIEMNDVFAKLRYGLFFFLNVDIQSKSRQRNQAKVLWYTKLWANSKQSLNSTEPKIAAPDILNHFRKSKYGQKYGLVNPTFERILRLLSQNTQCMLHQLLRQWCSEIRTNSSRLGQSPSIEKQIR